MIKEEYTSSLVAIDSILIIGEIEVKQERDILPLNILHVFIQTKIPEGGEK